ncbi:6464_t:CDS:2 [Entrophospora sp. SA101]|nr:6464_t:CDS:2 [Entrophospora sp. SA101]CAJ0912428.1 5632_t:CDS:2 [Entrophospora sp. SA101]CAJ0912439.1 5638_t:CDS:2 [Entrophospora sp. SA101]CAJ0912450.1 5644_t:CDS:2 [Entrophospora sp. SA101]CAJ0912464.1 5651_t:CDS:2 [Entrophospora sp. SA101]
MFGAFKTTMVTLGGLLWKNPSKMSRTRKANVRKRLKAVDRVISVLVKSGVECKALEELKKLPKESKMKPRDKYTVFSRTSKHYRKSFHKVPKFTKVTMRTSPPGF